MKTSTVQSLCCIFFLLLVLSGCIGLKPYYAKSQLKWESSTPPDSTKLKYSVFIVGDAGKPDDNRQEPTLKLLQSQLYDSLRLKPGDTSANYSKPEDVVVFVGDNIYETGLPEPDAPDRKEKERRIIEQMNVVKNFRGRKIFIPGNHDWNESRPGGLAAINRQEEFVENYLDSNDVFLPSNGCPGPIELQLNKDLVVIVLDSEWWLHKYEKPAAPDNGCTAGSRLEIMQQVKDILLRNRGKNIIITQHHPLFSNGKHGGFFTLKDYLFPLTLVRENLYIPLPILGSVYPLMRQYGISRQDLSNKDYQQLKRGLLSVLEGEQNVVLATGHEHALQFNKYRDLNLIISGAGAKSNAMAKGNGAMFAHGHKGFSRINYYDNGQSWVEFWEPLGDGTEGKLVYRSPLYAIPPKGRREVNEEKQINYSDSTKIIAAGSEYRISGSRRKMFGEHYRETWATPVKAPYLDMSVFAGGLSPVKMGGGKQTTSLQLQGKDGNIYQFRTITKDPGSLLPEGFLRTFADDFFQDQISASHPYAGLMIPGMAKAIGIYYVNPKLVYMPYTRLLGPYIQQVGGKLGTIEARPDDDVSDFRSFGNAKNAVSTKKLFEKLQEDNDNEADQQMFLKARLFDLIINDWDRHDDQWRWAEFKKDNRTIYRAIPRDRDQAFTKYDGFLPKMVAKVVPDLQHFGYQIKDVAKLSIAARNLDRNLLNQLTEQQWLSIAEQVKTALADKVIEDAVKQMPPEVYYRSGDEIIAKLKSRRDSLLKTAADYYRILAKEVTITGSDKKEFFHITGFKDSTIVTVHKINSDEKPGRTIYRRTFYKNDTEMINLFALQGRDSILAEGEASGIRFRVIGGGGKDAYADRSAPSPGRYIKYFDTKRDNNTDAGSNTKLRLSSNPLVNEYNRNAFNYNISLPGPSFDFNSADLLFIGAGYYYRNYRFRKEPYNYSQLITGNVAPYTGAYNIQYKSEYYSLFKRNYDLLFSAGFNGPKFTFNYFGAGNSTPNNAHIDYYRIISKNLNLQAFFQRRFSQALKVGIGPGFERYWIQKRANRFLTSPDFKETEDIARPSSFGAVKSYANFEFVDNPVSPNSGLRWMNEVNYYSEIKGARLNFLQLKSSVSFYGTPNFDFPVTAAISFGAATNIGEYKFFQANSLGNNTNLRGYRNNRFSGKSYLYNNTELRFKVTNIRNYIFTGNFGVFGFFDTGRVFLEHKQNKSTWHTGYGPGLWINMFNKLLLSGGYGMSKEGGYVSVNSGFAF